MASNAILDRLNCTFNEQVSFFEKARKLSEIKRLCQETLSADYKAKAKRGIEREVFVCNFAQLQFPTQQLRACNHFPIRYMKRFSHQKIIRLATNIMCLKHNIMLTLKTLFVVLTMPTMTLCVYEHYVQNHIMCRRVTLCVRVALCVLKILCLFLRLGNNMSRKIIIPKYLE